MVFRLSSHHNIPTVLMWGRGLNGQPSHDTLSLSLSLCSPLQTELWNLQTEFAHEQFGNVVRFGKDPQFGERIEGGPLEVDDDQLLSSSAHRLRDVGSRGDGQTGAHGQT